MAPLRRLLALLVGLVAIAFLVVVALQVRTLVAGSASAYVDATTYQSVVLTTNQVYFGKLKIDGDVYTLTDVYALNATGDTGSGTIQLVKRGSELNGPEEPLVIPGHAVLFFENMRPDSQVMQAIAKIRSGQTSTPPPATATPARTATPSPTR